MPMLVNKLIFKIIPERSPFFIRPLLRSVFNKVSALMLDPRLKNHSEFVSTQTKGRARLEVLDIAVTHESD